MSQFQLSTRETVFGIEAPSLIEDRERFRTLIREVVEGTRFEIETDFHRSQEDAVSDSWEGILFTTPDEKERVVFGSRGMWLHRLETEVTFQDVQSEFETLWTGYCQSVSCRSTMSYIRRLRRLKVPSQTTISDLGSVFRIPPIPTKGEDLKMIQMRNQTKFRDSSRDFKGSTSLQVSDLKTVSAVLDLQVYSNHRFASDSPEIWKGFDRLWEFGERITRQVLCDEADIQV